MATPYKSSTEFLVNTLKNSYQEDSSITALTDGRFVVTWEDKSRDLSDQTNTAIMAQVFNTDGTKSGRQFQVNTIERDYQVDPQVEALADGGFVIVWRDDSRSEDDSSSSAIRAQRYDADGTALGDEFLVNTTIEGLQIIPQTLGLPDGRFVIAWEDQSETGGDASGRSIRAQIFNADGSKSGSEFLVNTTTQSNQGNPVLAALSDGRFVIGFTDQSETSADTSGAVVLVQLFNTDGSKTGGELQVNTTTDGWQNIIDISALEGGGFVVTFEDRSLSADDPSGFFAARAQVFDANGIKVGPEILVPTTLEGLQRAPHVTPLNDGRFVVTWTDGSQSGQDTSDGAIRAQMFNPDGSKSGAEFLVNTITHWIQRDSDITTLPDGRFVISWTDYSESPDDRSSTAIRAQIFDPRSEAVDLDGSLTDDMLVGTRFHDVLEGLNGDDRLLGHHGHDTLGGNRGADALRGGVGADHLDGGKGSDRLFGGKGADHLRGGLGSDSLFGGRSNDTLLGSGGNDVLHGGNGRDVFVFSGNFGKDKIVDLTALDVIDLSGVSSITDYSDLISTHLVNSGGQAQIVDDKGNSLLLVGISFQDLQNGTGGFDDTLFVF